jgi:hypothetical protein
MAFECGDTAGYLICLTAEDGENFSVCMIGKTLRLLELGARNVLSKPVRGTLNRVHNTTIIMHYILYDHA